MRDILLWPAEVGEGGKSGEDRCLLADLRSGTNNRENYPRGEYDTELNWAPTPQYGPSGHKWTMNSISHSISRTPARTPAINKHPCAQSRMHSNPGPPNSLTLDTRSVPGRTRTSPPPGPLPNSHLWITQHRLCNSSVDLAVWEVLLQPEQVGHHIGGRPELRHLQILLEVGHVDIHVISSFTLLAPHSHSPPNSLLPSYTCSGWSSSTYLPSTSLSTPPYLQHPPRHSPARAGL